MRPNVKLDKQKESGTVSIHGLSHDGRGIATINNKTAFIHSTLPTETITYQVTRKHRRYYEADPTAILCAAPNRVPAPCPHFGECGGCNLQHMNMAAQLALKQQTLLEQLQHFGKVTPAAILPPLTAHDTGYRRKARLGVRFVYKKNKLLIGFRERANRYLADLTQCVVLHPHIGQRFAELSQLIASLAAYQEIPQIEVAMGDTDAALIFRHLVPLSDADKEKLIAFGQEYQFHIYVQPNPPEPVSPLWPENITPQRLTYTLPDYQLTFAFHPLDFTQINLEMNRLMVKQAIELLALTTDDTVLDLFCGIGNFTLPIARHVKQVTGIEGAEEMVARGQENAAYNHISNADFYAANLEKPSAAAPWLQQKYDKIILDPPRLGAQTILPYLQSCAAKRIVYISCNPATLARDAGELVKQYGYRLTAAGIMNMFPHTAHVEAMAVFEE